jgi:predicted dithiol-disulfide oxidoreductase (DUF899 family)
MKSTDSNYPNVVTRTEWLAARKKLLVKEKDLTRQRDALNADRRRLPMVRVDKEYVFDGPKGKASLLDLFEGRPQLIVYHFMWLWDAGKPLEYNYMTKAEHEKAGTSYYFQDSQPFDLHGLSCFLRDGDKVFHTYSTFGRGAEAVGGAYYFLDLTALGRQEDWEEPKGRATGLGAPAGSEKIVYPDEYEESEKAS